MHNMQPENSCRILHFTLNFKETFTQDQSKSVLLIGKLHHQIYQNSCDRPTCIHKNLQPGICMETMS